MSNTEKLQKDPATNSVDNYKGAYTAKELFQLNIQEVPFLVENLIPQSGLCCLTGSSDCNKSTLLRQLSFEIAMGLETFLGFKMNPKYKRVVYISTEDDFKSIAALIRKQYPDGMPDEIFDRIYFIFNTEKHIQELKEYFSKNRVDAVIIDTWTDLYGGDLNQSNKVRASFDIYSQLANIYGCAFIFIHHKGKRTEDKSPSKNNLLGSQGIEAKMRTLIELRREAGNRRLLTVVKGNYTSDDIKGKSFLLELNNSMRLQRVQVATNEILSFENVKTEKDEMKKISAKLRGDGLSFEKVHKHLQEKYGTNAPGLTTLKNWTKDQSDSQSPSK
ncbi:AAA domain-containing protein [Chitinophaga sp. YR573]|uniref:AAA family ATPase n=1 Tax=Chitinophaga sp. YR573 TaxID=1881040 RepID=UPI0008CCAAD1|nr:AAA family ATPase [Chitinophaga sp. YR573]SEW35745.1 AAA domain-containing protein [Chitinophaga sp. YR573]